MSKQQVPTVCPRAQMVGKNSLKDKKYNKLNKGVWGMPRLSEAKKDVISCEKLRGSAHTM
jgi:hypothetical protein